jgi:hypothetical protein
VKSVKSSGLQEPFAAAFGLKPPLATVIYAGGNLSGLAMGLQPKSVFEKDLLHRPSHHRSALWAIAVASIGEVVELMQSGRRRTAVEA